MARDSADTHASGGWQGEIAFIRRALIVLALGALALLAWTMRGALLLVFAAVVVAVLLLACARPLETRLRLSRGISLALVGLALAGIVALVAWLVGSQLRAQLGTLTERLPEALAAVEQRLGAGLPAMLGAEEGTGPAAILAQHLASVGVLAFDAASAAILAVVGGFFLAADPGTYRRGLVKLLPQSQHNRLEEALATSGTALGLWLRAQLVGMAIVGTLTGLGAWAIGLPAPLALGLVAAFAEFVPMVGPVAAAVPAMILAVAQGDGLWLWTLALYVAIQQVESNMIMPLIGRHMVEIPPAVLLFAVVAAGAALGIGGVLLAAPLTVVAFVLVGRLYVRETLGEHAAVPGEGAKEAEAPAG